MHVIRGQLVNFTDSTGQYWHEERGALVAGSDGRILWLGPFDLMPRSYESAAVSDYGECLILPGFIDAHVHFPQYRLLAAPGKDLLDWLRRFTFPEEARYSDPAYGAATASVFIDRLFQHGTTAASAYCSVHKVCADALFAEAERRNMSLVTGKTLMDRLAPDELCDNAESDMRETVELYKQWHGRSRLRYAVTPRFAITSSEGQLQRCGELMADLPDALLQTHLSESPAELAAVRALFPNDLDYTAIYDRFGLVTDRSLFAHGVHLSERECQRLHEAEASVIHCPTSNNFLGSGLMRFAQLREQARPVAYGIATDVGGGTSYSMLQTLGEAYKVQMLSGYRPTAIELFHLATRGNAERLKLGHEIGALERGKWADLVVLDLRATPVLADRADLSQSLEDMLFALALLGDDRAVRATYVAGNKVHERLSA
ncbi:guanine deaminase [Dongia soli]|uniref:Guanine deaminase n=1 Tax=Dongia soli TaxID=600628 RepID=A0ABU5E5P5_9PROT|nr:guanine deaminase [Dongia soli]MDY0881607.1 guanine deaminase [Dongia soli]